MIDVLLATYRPHADWLAAQIASIRGQKGVAVNLLQREDAAGEGAAANFSALLAESKAPYTAFSDQDDVWLPEKLSKLLAKMQALETRYGRETPCLVFCDSALVDADLKILEPSFLRAARLNPTRLKFRQLVLQNVPSGHQMLINAALRRLCTPIPSEAVMHDHWISLIAARQGHIAFLDESLVLYRQHAHNVFGGQKVGLRYFLFRMRQGVRTLRERLYRNFRQAALLIPALRGFEHRNWFVRRYLVFRYGLFKAGLLRNLGTWIVM